MSDINEEIVRLYFELEGYMVHSNLKYMIHKKSSGESDIDLAIMKEDPPDKAIVEVKGWHTSTFSLSFFKTENKKDIRSRLFHFIRPEALAAANKYFKSNKYRKILVVPKISENNRDEILRVCKDKGVDLLEFKNILPLIIDKTKINKNYRDSEFQQAVRLMKAYGFVREEKKNARSS